MTRRIFYRSYRNADGSNPEKAVQYPEVLQKIPGASGLHTIRQRRLALLLVESRVLYELIKEEDAVISPKSAGAEIRNLLGSLDRISRFAQRAADKSADGHKVSADAMFRLVEEAGESRYSLRQFFENAQTIHQIAKKAEAETQKIITFPNQGTAIAWLCGERLPEVYTSIFQKKFTTTRENNPGINFVKSALRAIRVKNAVEDETILYHYKNTQRGGAV